MRPVKALSLTQPWAIACVYRRPDGSVVKGIETRDWRSWYTGELLIHAAKGFPKGAQMFATEMASRGVIPRDLAFGAIIGRVEMTGCERVELLEDRLLPEEEEWGDYSDGRFGFLFEEAELFPEPIPCRGALGLWTVPPEIVALIPEAAR